MSVTLNLTGNAIQAEDAGVLIPAYEIIDVPLTASSATQTVRVLPALGGNYQVAGVSSCFSTASSSGTVQVEVATGTQAPGSGTNQLTGTLALSGTANTVSNGTVIASPTTIAPGNRVNIIIGGTMTSLANGMVEIVLKRVS